MIDVLFFIHDLSGGGAEKVLVNLVNNMDKRRFNVTVQTLFDQGINKQYLNSDINYKFTFKNVFRGNQHILKLFSPNFLFKKMIKEEYDIVISYMQGATTRIVSGGKNNSKVLINWVHNEMSKEKLSRAYRSYYEFEKTHKTFDTTVFVAKSAQNIFEKETGLLSDNIVKYNTVDTNDIIEKSKESIHYSVKGKETFSLITVGSLTEQKGYERLLRIINRINKEGLKLHLEILGDGPLRPRLENYIVEQNLENAITLLGYKSNPYKHVKNADLFICSSYHEGYSTVVTESLIVGTPVLTTLCSGMKEMLGDNNEYGVIVENSEQALYEGLKRFIVGSDLLKHYTMKAQQRANYFSKERTVYEVEKMFFDLVNSKNDITKKSLTGG